MSKPETPLTLEDVLTPDVRSRAESADWDAADAAWKADLPHGLDAVRPTRHEAWLRVVSAALAPYERQREQAIREDERRKVLAKIKAVAAEHEDDDGTCPGLLPCLLHEALLAAEGSEV